MSGRRRARRLDQLALAVLEVAESQARSRPEVLEGVGRVGRDERRHVARVQLVLQQLVHERLVPASLVQLVAVLLLVDAPRLVGALDPLQLAQQRLPAEVAAPLSHDAALVARLDAHEAKVRTYRSRWGVFAVLAVALPGVVCSGVAIFGSAWSNRGDPLAFAMFAFIGAGGLAIPLAVSLLWIPGRSSTWTPASCWRADEV